jgi:hypothetical protein
MSESIVDLLKIRLDVEEKVLDKISRFLMLLETKQPGAVRNYRNVCINPANPNNVVIVFEDAESTFSMEYPADIVNSLNIDKLTAWFDKQMSESEEDKEKRAREFERKVFENLKKKYTLN